MEAHLATLSKAKPRPAALKPRRPMIAAALNEQVAGYIRWSTPSILEGQERVHDVYGSDVSISASGIVVEVGG